MAYKDPEKAKAYDRKRNQTEKRREYDAKRRATPEYKASAVARARAARANQTEADRAKKAHFNRKYTYQLTEAELVFVAAQNTCEACGSSFCRPGDKHLDHDHTTGLFRGVLCQGCNLAEGFLKGSLERVLALGVYIEKHKLARGRPIS
jgi:hypothetical protein